MDVSYLLLALLLLLPAILLAVRRKGSSRTLPPRSMGFPIIGQSISLLRAMRANTADEWLQDRVRKYGPISKLSLFGKPTVFLHGQVANRFIFTGDSTIMTNQQPQSVSRIMGNCSLLDLSGEDHKRVRDALVSFLKPESLKHYVGKMDEEIRRHLELNWQDKQKVAVLPSTKIITFNIICSLLFGLERGFEREKFLQNFQEMMGGMWSVPINLPFTRYSRSVHASLRVMNMVRELVREKKLKLEQKLLSPHQDLITRLLSIHDERNKPKLSEDEIVHKVMLIMVAGHDTSSVLITFILRLLSNNAEIYTAVRQEQLEIRKGKAKGEPLTWEDLAQMKYTWRVAMETLRTVPPVFGGFRRTLKDIEYKGYTIPKGWQIFWAAGMTHFDETLFPEPSKFNPARFENQASIPPYCFIPFGAGPRICPGNEFARIETLVATHYLVTQFSWKLCSDNSFGRDPMPVPSQGLLIEILLKNQT